MNTMELIKARRSVRTFDGRQVATEDKEKLCAYIETIKNPQGIPVEFVLLDAKEHGLSSSVIAGETLYIAGKAPEGTHSEEAFGYSFEKMVLCAQSLGLGTTWIAGTLDRDLFNKAAGTKPGGNHVLRQPPRLPRERNVRYGDEVPQSASRRHAEA